METTVLVATHLSSLYASTQGTIVTLPTARRSAPLASRLADSDPPAEHASHSSVFHSETTGTIVLRVIDGGLAIELISLTSDIPPVRFVFPDTILPTPGIFLSASQELHILAVTTTGSLYRLVLPVPGGVKWHPEQLRGNWCREYIIKHGSGILEGLVAIQGTHCVVVGHPNGVMLRLETEVLGDDANDDVWTESTAQHASIFSALTSFLHTTVPEGLEFVSMAPHPQPTENGNVYTISRDRVLRVWSPKGGCVAARTLPTTPTGRALTPAPPNPTTTAKSPMLLDSGPQNLLSLVDVLEEPDGRDVNTFAITFVPTPSTSTSGGFFHVFSSTDDHPRSLTSIDCPVSTAYCQLQDFVVSGNMLYALWNRHGQSTLDRIPFTVGQKNSYSVGNTWQSSSFAAEPVVAPPHTDELLLSRGSLTDKLFEAIMKPGTFSPLTLKSAIQEYVEEFLSLPGAVPSQLQATYATVGEQIAAVVGCTVSLTRDPQTGAQLYDKYWSALKRDWEGFIGRCNRIERSARLPLSLGVSSSSPWPIFIERERIGAMASEDMPMRLYRGLTSDTPTEPSYPLLELMRKLRNGLGKPTMLALESSAINMVHEEVAFPFADNIAEQARQLAIGRVLDEGFVSWINGGLQAIPDLDSATRVALDLIGGFDKEVKREEDEVELLLPPTNSAWAMALAASYAAASVRARYDLCLSVITLLFFHAEELPTWQPTLLADVLAVFRGIAMLLYVSQQSAGDAHATRPTERAASADDIAARMQDMHMARARGPRAPPSNSLLHRLLTQEMGSNDPALSAHRFLDHTGLLASASPAHATRMEVLFCENMRLTGHLEAARETIDFLPRTPGVTYVLARLWLDEGRIEDAADLFELVAGSFGSGNGLSTEDSDALSAVLPGGALFDSQFSYYADTASHFARVLETYYEVHFTQLALSVAPAGVDTSELRQNAIKGSIDIGQYEDAYSCIAAMPYDRLKKDCISNLVHRMCEANAVEKLMAFNFAGMAEDVGEALSFEARNADPRDRPFYSRILYSWFVGKGDYRNAAFTMYQRARKLVYLMGKSQETLELAELAGEAYVVAINALSMLDPKNAWIILPLAPESDDKHPTKRRKLCKHIPESKFTPGKRDSELVEIADIQREYALISARLDLLRRDPALLLVGGANLPPSSIVSRLAHAKRFNTALATARSLDVDMSDLFAHLADQCLRLSRNPDAVMQEDTSDWLLTDKVSSWPGTPAERGWRYLRQALERHDGLATEFRYNKAVLEAILSYDRAAAPPPWLITVLEEHHPEYLMRAHLRYENIEYAFEAALSHIRKVDAQLSRYPLKTAMSTWLPYTVFDDVLALSKAQEGLSPKARRLRQELDTELSNHVKRVQKLGKFAA